MFIARGLPATVIEDLQATIDTLQAAIDRRLGGKGKRVCSNADLQAVLRVGRVHVATLDGVMRIVHKNFPGLLASGNPPNTSSATSPRNPPSNPLQIPAAAAISDPRSGLAHLRRRLTLLRMSTTITVRLPEDLDQWLEEESRKTGLPKGRIVRQHLEASRTREARQPFLDLAGSVEGKPGLSRKRGFQR